MSKNLSKELCYSFYTVEKLFLQFYTKNLKEFDLTYTQYLVLLVLWEEQSLPLKDLGAKIGLASNTLTPLLKRLEDKGFILRMKPSNDKRQLYVQLTEMGKELELAVKTKVTSCFVEKIGFSREEADRIIVQNNQLASKLFYALSD